MDRMVYISAVGLHNIEQAQTARANNLANVSTDGFRADLARVVATEVEGDGYHNRVYGVNQSSGVDMTPGGLIETGRELDIAISGKGLLAVVTATGEEAYTRNGSLRLDPTGQLVTSQGYAVLGQGGPISLPPYESIMFGSDGTITVRPQGQGPDALVQIDRLKLVDAPAESLKKLPSGLIAGKDGVALQPATDVNIQSGFIESSNVNAINELTEILTLARQFELEVRMMQVAQTNDEASEQLLRVG